MAISGSNGGNPAPTTTFTATATYFSNNDIMYPNYGAYGGAIYNEDATINLNGCKVSESTGEGKRTAIKETLREGWRRSPRGPSQGRLLTFLSVMFEGFRGPAAQFYSGTPKTAFSEAAKQSQKRCFPPSPGFLATHRTPGSTFRSL